MDNFDVTDFLLRLLFALALVFLTYNPTGWSYYHWVADVFPKIQPLQAVAGLALLMLWIFLWRSMMKALGMLGFVLVVAFTAALVWLFASWGWLDIHNATTMAWVVLSSLGVILGVGMSWSIIRRQLTGQASVDEISDNV
ncbi:MAG TPA: DUF6524 family protein [Steroidobacteraceae bacterium]|nr:DUF6524 family protein [Steroidobacteraceae bacterium]